MMSIENKKKVIAVIAKMKADGVPKETITKLVEAFKAKHANDEPDEVAVEEEAVQAAPPGPVDYESLPADQKAQLFAEKSGLPYETARERLAYGPDVVRAKLQGDVNQDPVKSHIKSFLTMPARGLGALARVGIGEAGNAVQLAKNLYSGTSGGYTSQGDILEAANNQMSNSQGIGGAIQNDPTLPLSMLTGAGLAGTALKTLPKVAIGAGAGGLFTGVRRDLEQASGVESPHAGLDYGLGIGLGGLGEVPFVKMAQTHIMKKLLPGATNEQAGFLSDLMRISTKRTAGAVENARAEALGKLEPNVPADKWYPSLKAEDGVISEVQNKLGTEEQVVGALDHALNKLRRNQDINYDDFEYAKKASQNLSKRLAQLRANLGMGDITKTGKVEIQDWIKANPRMVEILNRDPNIAEQLLKGVDDPRDKALISTQAVKPKDKGDFSIVGGALEAVKSSAKPIVATAAQVAKTHATTPVARSLSSLGSTYPKYTTVSQGIEDAKRKKDKK